MHTVTDTGTSVPAFLGKLWRLVEDPETDDLICWSPSGRSFYIRNQAKFARDLLPHYYKHNNMASFVRQLNMYGFHKKVSVELGGLKCDKDEMEFAHQYFCKDHPYLLDHIKRKIASNKTQDPSQTPIKPELMNRMLTEVRSMRGRQEQLDSKLGNMKRENEALWRELALLRQKHHHQSKVVEKLIHFFFTFINPNRSGGLSMKRRFPLMINDSNPRLRNKISKVQQSPSGPAIHELDSEDPDLDSSDYIVAEMLDNDQLPTIESPDHQSIPDDNAAEYFVHEPPQEIRHNSRKRHLKNKKKGRKNKVPIKIMIPSTENGKEPREETLLLDVPLRKPSSMSLLQPTPNAPMTNITKQSVPSMNLNRQQVSGKPVPPATVRSSKLAAMAANMKNTQNVDLDLDGDSFAESEENTSKDDSLIKLENIMIVPDIINDEYSLDVEDNAGHTIPSSVSSLSGNSTNNGSPGGGDNSLDVGDMGSGSFGSLDFKASSANDSSTINQEKSVANTRPVDTRQNMSLSYVNPNGMTEANYREEVDTHLDTMQSELENLREILRGEGYSIDANTLLGLFGTEDPMSFGIPVNPDLDPNPSRENDNDDHQNKTDQNFRSNSSGKLMAYTSTPSLLDFDDDMFLAASSSSPGITGASSSGERNTEPLDQTDNKALLDSLLANHTNSSQT